MERSKSAKAEIRIAYVGDGMTVAQSIAKKFARKKYNIFVELLDFRYQPSLTELLSPCAEADSRAYISLSLLLVTPAMMKYLKGVKVQTRSYLTNLMTSNLSPVALSFFVSQDQVKEQIEVTFTSSDLTWRHLEIGESRESFQQCMIELISMMEEGHETMPIPSLKRYHLLPNKPVVAGDMMYILLDKQVVGSNHDQSLKVVFKDDCTKTARQISDCLFQFEVPECSKSSSTLEVFTSSGLSIGTDIISYRDRLQVLADVINDIVCQVVKMCQNTRNKELPSTATDYFITDWLTSNDNNSPDPDIKKIVTQWAECLKSSKVSFTCMYHELPTLLYLLRKYCPHKSISSLEVNSWLSERSVLNMDESTSDKMTSCYQNNQLSETSNTEHNTPSSFSGDEDGQLYVSPDYWTLDKPLQKSQFTDEILDTNVNTENNNQRDNSTSSVHTPQTVSLSLMKQPLSKSYLPVCTPLTTQQPYYVNTTLALKPQLQRHLYTSNHHETTNSQDSGCSNKDLLVEIEKWSLFPKVNNESLSSLSTEVAGPEVLTKEGEERNKLRCAQTLFTNVKKNKLESLMDSPKGGKPVVPQKSSHTIKFFSANNKESQEQENLSHKFKSDNNRPHLPSRSYSDSSKQFAMPKPEVFRSQSLSYLASTATPLLFSANSLTRLDKRKLKLHCKTLPATTSTHMGSQNTVSNSQIPSPEVPYHCRPPPLLPKNPSHRHRHQLLNRTNSDTCVMPVPTCVQSDSGCRFLQSPGNQDSDNDESILPDYSQPFNVCFSDCHPCSNHYDVLKSDQFSEQEESIYVDVDEVLKNTDLIENNCTVDDPRMNKNSKMSTSLPSLSSSKSSSVRILKTKKTSPHSSPIWSSISSILTLRRSGRANRDYTTKM